MYVVLLLVAILATSSGQTDFECPTPTPPECMDGNPCEEATCPRFTSALNCCPETLNGECTARFYRSNARRPINRDLCFRNIEYCTPTSCNAKRVCVEEVVPCTRENCDHQAITAKCELIDAPLPVTDCSQVECRDADTVCMVITRRNRTQAKCVPFKPTTCEDMECDEGMVCEMRRRLKDEKEVPRCKLENPSASRAEDCSRLTCREGMVCAVLNSGMAKCVMMPPPTDCKELDCGEGMECKEVGNKDRVKCVASSAPVVVSDPEETPTSNLLLITPRGERGCSELDCDAGFVCRMTANRARNGDRRLRPTCIPMQCSGRRLSRPPRSCEELECGRGEECVECQEGGNTRARCQRLQPTRTPEDKERSTNEGREKPTDRANEEKEKPTSETDEDGDRSDEDIGESVPDEDRDTSGKTGEDKDGESVPDDEKPTDLDKPGTPDERRRGRRPPVMCEEVQCGEEEMCFEFEHEERRLARCVSADSPVECKDADCDEEREECAELKNDAVSGLVVCLRRNRTRATPTPDGGHPELPRRAQSCQDLDCERGFECLHSRRDGRGQARCRRISKRAGQCFVLESAPIFDRPNVTRPTRRPDATRPVTNRRPDATRPVTNRRPDVTRAVTADVQQPTRRPVRGLELTINLPDRCVERECCGGERCIMRRMFDNRAPLAVCVPVPSDDSSRAEPVTCEELECEEGFFCQEAMRPTRRPRPTGERPTGRPRPTGERPTGRPRPTGERPTGTGRPRPTGERPTGRPRPTGERPTGTGRPRPTGERPTGTGRPRPTGERPTGRPRPTGERPTGQLESVPQEQVTGRPRPTGERPTGRPSPTGERPTGRPRPTGEHPTGTGRPRPTGEHPTRVGPTGRPRRGARCVRVSEFP